MVGLGRLELPTSRLSGVRSNQLSYRPAIPIRYNLILRKRNEDGEDPAMFVRKLTIYIPRISKENNKLLSLRNFLRKEVIQPQVPLRLPCYDFTPVTDLTVVSCLLAVSELPSGKTNSHGVTGGVYKARERIHRGMLIRDY